tara:strand:+ start:7003 stop:7437 length:435 start_codon:yes stop_codon:yes gene_type:complete
MKELLKTFFRKTYYFWVISRLLYIVLFTIAIINLPNEKSIPKISVKLFFAIYTLAIFLLSILEILKKDQPKFIRKFVGIVSILFGIFLNYLLIFEFNQRIVILAFTLTFWIILYGIWEITKKSTLQIKRLARTSPLVNTKCKKE